MAQRKRGNLSGLLAEKHEGTNGGERSLAGFNEIGGRRWKSVVILVAGHREVVHLTVPDDPRALRPNARSETENFSTDAHLLLSTKAEQQSQVHGLSISFVLIRTDHFSSDRAIYSQMIIDHLFFSYVLQYSKDVQVSGQ